MVLMPIHPSQMDLETSTQFNHIQKAARDTFLKEWKNFRQIGFAILLQPKLFESPTQKRDVFVLNIRLRDVIKIDCLDVELAKIQFHRQLELYSPQSDNRVIVEKIPVYTAGIHITRSRWAGKYYEDSRTLSLLIQGLVHANGDN